MLNTVKRCFVYLIYTNTVGKIRCMVLHLSSRPHFLLLPIFKNHSSICFPRNAAAVCASLISAFDGILVCSPRLP